MNTNIHRANSVNFKNFEFGDPTVNKYGGKSCKVKYESSDFYLQLPRMRLPYGMSVYEDKDPEGNVSKSKYSMDFSLGGYEMNEDGEPGDKRIYEFFKFLEGMQELLINNASKNSSDWLGIDNATVEVARALCRENIRYSKDKVTKKISNKYPPTFKARVGFWDGRFTVNAFDQDKNPIENLYESCAKGSEAITIVKLTQVTFAGGKCGFSWNVHQVKLFPPARMPSYAFIEDEEDNKPVKVNTPAEDEDTEEPSTVSEPRMVDDSDDDDDDEEDDDELDEEEEEERPPTPPPPKKKVVKRKPKKSE